MKMKKLVVILVGIATSAAASGNVPPGAYFVLPGVNHIEAIYREWNGPYRIKTFNEMGEEKFLPFAIKVEGGIAEVKLQEREVFLKPLISGSFKISAMLLAHDISRSYGYPTLAKTQVTFTNLVEGQRNVIRIYNGVGELVKVIETDKFQVNWDLRNEGGRELAWGIYIYIIECNGDKKAGKIAIVK